MKTIIGIFMPTNALVQPPVVLKKEKLQKVMLLLYKTLVKHYFKH